MSSPTKPQIMRITLVTEDESGTQMRSLVREVLAFIQKTRPGIAFDISEDCSQAKDSDAVILCGKISPQLEGDLTKKLGSFVNVQPVFLPSTGLVPEHLLNRNAVQGLDIIFVNGIENTQGKDGTPCKTIEQMVQWAGTYAMRSHPPKPIHFVSSSRSAVSSVVTEVLNEKFPRVALSLETIDTVMDDLALTLKKLNGIVLTTESHGILLPEKARSNLQLDALLASANISILSNNSSTNQGIFRGGNTGAHGKKLDPISILPAVSLMLGLSLGLSAEAAAVTRAIRRTLDPIELIGSNIRTPCAGGEATTAEFMIKFMEHLDSYLEAAISEAEAQKSPRELFSSSIKRRPMGVIEKTMTHAAVGLSKPEVQNGEIICVQVDWTLTSEILWAGMEKTYDKMGRPRLHRNDRMWLAIDHTVDPRTNHRPRQRGLIEQAESFQREAKLVNFLPANTSILHTDFTRDRALPGQIIVGCDSHSCSAGCVGALAVGLGAADVVMPMVTGETWFRVPEICRINFVGKLPFGVGGKDVILHILALFKRNTIAFQRAVEYGGPGLKELSMDARFAIANMTTEFGGMGACFEADESTAEWISRRPHLEHQGGLYFRADSDAQYAEVRNVDLSEVELTIALYPDPDNVVPVKEKVGTKLDGCFIGACTTTEEDLIIGALVLDAGLRAGKVPCEGRRRVTPGSLSIIKHLKRHGVWDIYRKAGFEIGAPGCSYCVGINDVDVAGEGEVWLSSQNRNFRNRMGKGAIGSITCAAVVAASSFDMVVTDARPLLSQIDKMKLDKMLGSERVSLTVAPEISEPDPFIASDVTLLADDIPSQMKIPTNTLETSADGIFKSKVQRFGENVDTDAIIPAEFVPGVDNAELGSHCFEYDRPVFRQKATRGSKIIVAGRGFGSGSSREDAVRALQGAGIEARLIWDADDRNQLNMGLFNITLPDLEFYTLAKEDSVVVIDRKAKTVHVAGTNRVFDYQQSAMEKTLLDAGGILPLYNRFGRSVFRDISRTHTNGKTVRSAGRAAKPSQGKFDW
ncbi:Aconitase/3-isopropylmalate dehydratase large subunit alpha/beta/alpha subdomain 1/3 [Penicillium odoratum]|uniref:Aconitase/3-isopropylmalate dehydratase large subunit alpha/beta/alpha subdomain 1/3 n=1 Tax=Penicillium odoratum TaxID=1167516 RepID=UPI0025481E27|nr:Aconitase/3-isopropylmalate dehydratase large subunit alpha/beta/alpha subdomain 1/3 [Penicillium odoratum]KAJ5771918.1 Aconitase/3-isopropylmalate dehydratase large subunit alpha/beta/alpha subdomain 1/3 [Penicillium odoratum]